MQPHRPAPDANQKIMITIDGLTKRYGRHTVVNKLSFTCAAGEVLGFLGPNGAGKSTTMKMLAGFVAPDAGSATICGHDVQTEGIAARQRLGYLPEGAPCYGEMTPATFLEFAADIRQLDSKFRQQRMEEVVEQLHLGPVLHQSVETLSKGFKRRVGLAQAILHDPEVLILDEPTDGLDPNQKHEVRNLIRSMSADKLVVISTHILEEVEAVCNRAIIISAGEILADDTPANLAAMSPYHKAVTLRIGPENEIDEVCAALSSLEQVDRIETDRDRRKLRAIPAADGPSDQPWRDISDLVANRGIDVAEISMESGRLDDVFRQITQSELA